MDGCGGEGRSLEDMCGNVPPPPPTPQYSGVALAEVAVVLGNDSCELWAVALLVGSGQDVEEVLVVAGEAAGLKVVGGGDGGGVVAAAAGGGARVMSFSA